MNKPGDINVRVASNAAAQKVSASIPSVIDDLADVDTSTAVPTDGQALVFDAASGLWIPADPPAPGASSLDGLSDVDTTTTAPADGQVLKYHAATGQWLPATPAAAGATNLDGLSDVDTTTTAPADGQVLKYHAATGQWLPAPPAAAGATNLDGLSDVDTTTTAPTEGQVLKYHAATGQWLPAAAATGKPWWFSPALASAFTLVGTVNPTLADDADEGLLFDAGTPVGGDTQRFAVRTLTTPASAWTLVVRMEYNLPRVSFGQMGIALRDTVSGRCQTFGVASSDGQTYVSNFNGLSGFSSTPASFTPNGVFPWYRVVFDGTNLIYSVSKNGKQWLRVLSQAATAWLTNRPNQVGVGISYNNTGTNNFLASFAYFSLTGPGV
jgi:hypothetical protein